MKKVPNFLAIIPARGGSKRLPGKNIVDFMGKPLIAWTIEAALKSNYINDVIVSTDDQGIADISKEFGAGIPYLRPQHLGGDRVSVVDVLIDFLQSLDNMPEYVIVLQPTSPLRSSFYIDDAINKMGESDASVSVTKVRKPSAWSNSLPKNGSITNFLNKSMHNRQSQELENCYSLNGAIYICKTDRLQKLNEYILKLSSYPFTREDIFRASVGLWTGNETQEERKKVQLKFNEEYNMYGRNLKVLLTTSAGAEGISLRNVREVHIMEPYWNRVRIEQVIGRARRVNSHLDLPTEQQNVTVLEYVCKFPEKLPDSIYDHFKQWLSYKPTKDETSVKLVKKRVLKKEMEQQYNLLKQLYNEIIKKDNNLTSDQDLYRIGIMKFAVNDSFLQLVKNSAVDCSINKDDNREAGIIQDGLDYNEILCFGEGVMEKYDYDIKTIENIPKQEDKYNFQLEGVEEEFQKSRKKRYEKKVIENFRTYLLPSKTYMLHRTNTVDNVKFSIINQSFRIVKYKNDSKLYNFYVTFGLDPLHNSYYNDTLRNTKMENIIIGEYLEKSDTIVSAKDIKINTSEKVFLYLLKLEKHLEKSWEYLTQQNQVSGKFRVTEENINALLILNASNELPFQFSFNNNTYKYSDFKNSNLDTDDIVLTQYLTNELIKLKLIYINNIINKPTKSKSTKTQKPKIILRKTRRKRGQVN